MLRLPMKVGAQLQDVDGHRMGAADVLIAINFLVNGRYYYGNLIGLTDQTGAVQLARDELDLRFAADRALFPMDYKVDLDDCDPIVEICLLSEGEIEAAKTAVQDSEFVTPEIRASYDSAKNACFRPVLTRVWADLPAQRGLHVLLPAIPTAGS